MGDNTDRPSSSKHKRHHEKDRDSEHRTKKKHKHDDDERASERRSKKRSSKGKDKLNIIDDDPDEDLWVEKNIDMDGENVRMSNPTFLVLEFNVSISAADNRHTHCRESEVDLPCHKHGERPRPAAQQSNRDET